MRNCGSIAFQTYLIEYLIEQTYLIEKACLFGFAAEII